MQWQEAKAGTGAVNQCWLYSRCDITEEYESPSDGRDWCFHILARNVTKNATNPFDSHTVYAAWQQTPIDDAATGKTSFYYAGGNGPHTGQRDDSIGLAYCPTDAYAGLQHIPVADNADMLETVAVEMRSERLWVLVASGAKANGGHAQGVERGVPLRLRVSISVERGIAAEGTVHLAGLKGANGPQRLQVEWDSADQALGGTGAMRSLVGAQARVRIEVVGAVILYAFGFDV